MLLSTPVLRRKISYKLIVNSKNTPIRTPGIMHRLKLKSFLSQEMLLQNSKIFDVYSFEISTFQKQLTTVAYEASLIFHNAFAWLRFLSKIKLRRLIKSGSNLHCWLWLIGIFHLLRLSGLPSTNLGFWWCVVCHLVFIPQLVFLCRLFEALLIPFA